MIQENWFRFWGQDLGDALAILCCLIGVSIGVACLKYLWTQFILFFGVAK